MRGCQLAAGLGHVGVAQVPQQVPGEVVPGLSYPFAACADCHQHCFSPNSVAVRANNRWQLQLSKLAVSDTAEQDKDGLLDAIACGFSCF